MAAYLRDPRCILVVWLCAVTLAACAVRFAPDYDDEIVQSLNSHTEETSKFFAKIVGGTNRADFGKRAEAYASLIGKYDALALRLEARAYPKPVLPGFLGGRSPVPSEAPSIAPIKKISATLEQMKKFDQTRSISSVEVAAYRKIFEIETRNALTYENALKRDSK